MRGRQRVDARTERPASAGRRLPLRYKTVLFSVLLVLIPMGVAGVYYNIAISDILTHNANDNLSMLVEKTSSYLESTFGTINSTMLHFMSSRAIRSWSFGENQGDQQEQDMYNLFVNKVNIEMDLKYSLLFNNAWEEGLVSSVFLFLNADTYISLTASDKYIGLANRRAVDVYKKLRESGEKGYKVLPPTQADPTIYFSRTISNLREPDQYLILMLGVDEAAIRSRYNDILGYPDTVAYVSDGQGDILSSFDSAHLGRNEADLDLGLSQQPSGEWAGWRADGYMVFSKPVGDRGLKFLAAVSRAQVYGSLHQSIRNYILFTLAVLLICLLISIMVSISFSGVIRNLLKGINRVSSGDYSAKLPPYRDGDLNQVSTAFNQMSDRIDYLVNEVFEKRILLKDAELKFLQSRINPHFLFNTLLVISYKAKFLNAEPVYDMLTSLMELLQVSTYSQHTDQVTVREELRYAQFYLHLQKERFGENLEYTIEQPDEETALCYLPKLCIEPIVENAVVHGTENKIGKCSVSLRVERVGDELIFTIRDDGVGFAPDMLADPDSGDVVRVSTKNGSIGLNNTHQRIRLLYGEAYGISVQSAPGRGTQVRVRVPAIRTAG